MIWSNEQHIQHGLCMIPGNKMAYIFRHQNLMNHAASSEKTPPTWLITTNKSLDGSNPATGGIVVHQAFPMFLAYWSEPQSADRRFLQHNQMELCITLPIPLNSTSEEALDIQANRDVWLEEAVASVLAYHDRIRTLHLDDSAMDSHENPDCSGRAITYTTPISTESCFRNF